MSDPVDHDAELLLLQRMHKSDLTDNPYLYTLFAFPWGEPGTPLAHSAGPRDWQREELLRIRDFLVENRARVARGQPPRVYKRAVASGRGVGKTALYAWVLKWLMDTTPGAAAVVTASTGDQLSNKMWAELQHWHGMSITRHWMDINSDVMKPSAWYARTLREAYRLDCGYHYASASLWRKENPDAFAGAHNAFGMLVLFDEASGIPQAIWDVTEGFFTELTVKRLWLTVSNPRRASGAFRDCFSDPAWSTRQLNALSVPDVDRDLLQAIVKAHGEDSYQAKVEVYGEFPSEGSEGFITQADCHNAARSPLLPEHNDAPLVMAVDVARYGDCESVVFMRKGRDARSLPFRVYQRLDTVQLAERIAELIAIYRPQAVVIDAVGVGAGVKDTLASWRYRNIFGHQGSNSPRDGRSYSNKRAEVWGLLRGWLRDGGLIPDDPVLIEQLVAVNYRFDNGGRIALESKEAMRGRGVASPDRADALAMTFSVPLAFPGGARPRQSFIAHGTDYPVFGDRDVLVDRPRFRPR